MVFFSLLQFVFPSFMTFNFFMDNIVNFNLLGPGYCVYLNF
jgi:hypothetical protein